MAGRVDERVLRSPAARRDAARRPSTRRLRDELGSPPAQMALAVPDFTYRAIMANGVVEHELCPVVVAETDDEPVLNPAEVDDAPWVGWEALCAAGRGSDRRRSARGRSRQIAHLAGLTPPLPTGSARRRRDGLDAAIVLPRRRRARRAAVAPDPLAPIGGDGRGDPRPGSSRARAARARGHRPVARGGRARRSASWSAPAASGCARRSSTGATGPAAPIDDRAVAHVAAAVEMLHTFALLHDDVMDRAATAAGGRPPPVASPDAHAADGSSATPTGSATSAAILAGDLAFVWADQLLDRAARDARR